MALILSPAKEGWKIISGPAARAALRLTSFRSAWPGLNSAAGYASSLNGSFLKALFYGTLSLSLLFLTGCPQPKPSGSNGGPGGPPEVRSSENVVRLGGAGAGFSTAGSGSIEVPIRIDEGYHINANPATFSYLIATEVTAEKVEGLEVGKPVYPAAVKKKFQFADQPLNVDEGTVNVTLPLTARFTGTRSLPIWVRVQACDQEKCFPPATLHATYPITVDAK